MLVRYYPFTERQIIGKAQGFRGVSEKAELMRTQRMYAHLISERKGLDSVAWEYIRLVWRHLIQPFNPWGGRHLPMHIDKLHLPIITSQLSSYSFLMALLGVRFMNPPAYGDTRKLPDPLFVELSGEKRHLLCRFRMRSFNSEQITDFATFTVIWVNDDRGYAVLADYSFPYVGNCCITTDYSVPNQTWRYSASSPEFMVYRRPKNQEVIELSYSLRSSIPILNPYTRNSVVQNGTESRKGTYFFQDGTLSTCTVFNSNRPVIDQEAVDLFRSLSKDVARRKLMLALGEDKDLFDKAVSHMTSAIRLAEQQTKEPFNPLVDSHVQYIESICNTVETALYWSDRRMTKLLMGFVLAVSFLVHVMPDSADHTELFDET